MATGQGFEGWAKKACKEGRFAGLRGLLPAGGGGF